MFHLSGKMTNLPQPCPTTYPLLLPLSPFLTSRKYSRQDLLSQRILLDYNVFYLPYSLSYHILHLKLKLFVEIRGSLGDRIPGMGEPCGLLSVGSHRVGHDWSHLATAAAGDSSKSFARFWCSPYFYFKKKNFYTNSKYSCK